MRTLHVWLLVAVLVLLPTLGRAISNKDKGETTTTIIVNSSTAGTEICAQTENVCATFVVPSSSVALWFARIGMDKTCASAMTTLTGIRRAPSQGYEFKVSEDGWMGRICAIRESGTGSDSVVQVQRW